MTETSRTYYNSVSDFGLVTERLSFSVVITFSSIQFQQLILFRNDYCTNF